MFQKLKKGFSDFAHDKPGERFINAHRRWNKGTKSPWVGFMVISVGVVLIVLGFLLGLVPGVPGIVLGFLGLALIATRFRRMALALDRAELGLRKTLKKWKKRPLHVPPQNPFVPLLLALITML